LWKITYRSNRSETEEMSLSNQLKTYIEVLALIAMFASVAFWFHAASINPPWAAMGTLGKPAQDVLQQLRRHGKQ
jgi:hypothetical protein